MRGEDKVIDVLLRLVNMLLIIRSGWFKGEYVLEYKFCDFEFNKKNVYFWFGIYNCCFMCIEE